MNDLENALVRANVQAAMKKAQAAPIVEWTPALLMRKGDAPGHEFRGNQYSGGGGGGKQAGEKYNSEQNKMKIHSVHRGIPIFNENPPRQGIGMAGDPKPHPLNLTAVDPKTDKVISSGHTTERDAELAVNAYLKGRK